MKPKVEQPGDGPAGPSKTMEDNMEKETKKKNKRKLTALAKDFREKILDYAVNAHKENNAKWHLPLCVLYATGCRPVELVKGVSVKYDDESKIIRFSIPGAKINDKLQRGIALRTVKIKIVDENNEILNWAKPLIEEIQKEKSAYIVVKTTSANAFSGYIHKASKKLWPRRAEHVSAYSFRHAVAKSLKDADADPVKIASVLGHASTRSQLSYGRKSRGGGKNVSPEVEVSTSAAIRDNKEQHIDKLQRFKIKSRNKLKFGKR